METFDAVVVGLGGAGSAVAYHLSRAGLRAVGIEQFETTHDHGSSHGKTRIYRTAYSEGEAYVPLSRRAQQLFFDLQKSSGTEIVRRTGGLFIGRADSATIRGALRSAKSYTLPHEVLSPPEVEARFPQFRLRPEEMAFWDPDAGVLFPENCIRAHDSAATERGASLRYGERVTKWSSSGESIHVQTDRQEYRARCLVLTAGAWTTALTRELDLPLTVERQFVLWFPAEGSCAVTANGMPVFIWDRRPALETYGIPDFGDGVKIGAWAGKTAPTPELADRELRESDAAPVREFARSSIRGIRATESAWASCLFTMAPDRNFVLGRHPQHSNVIVVSACSGHGFKFTSVIGEVVAKLASGDRVDFDISMFDVGRFLRHRRL